MLPKLSLALACFVGLALSGCERKSELPKLKEIESFSLRDQQGRTFTDKSLKGKVWAVNFFFTSCPTMCPALTKKMKAFQSDMKGTKDLQILSVSVDPKVDKPERLLQYAKNHEVDQNTWTFVTGDTDKVKKMVVDGFKVAMGEKKELPRGGYDIVHATHVVLVDREKNIRGYYRSDDEGLAKLRDDAKKIAAN